MKYLLHRLSALLLAALLLLSSVPLVGAAGDQPDPSCTLGTFSGDMLVGANAAGATIKAEPRQGDLFQETPQQLHFEIEEKKPCRR